MRWYPLELTAHVRSYAFGERLIPERLGKREVPEGVVAETWEISDYRQTTGTVRHGDLAGRTLHDIVTAYPEELVGVGWSGPHFPLLAKFLDASHMLPVHLHADNETARQRYGEPHGKSEAWHILWAAPEATILAGIKPGLSREDLIAAFKAQDYDAVMYRYPINTGDTVYVPAGALHAFGPDTLIFEIQQTSDLSQMVMPHDVYGNLLDEATWQRNIEATLAELRTEFLPQPHQGLAMERHGNRYSVGCAGPYFALERWTLAHDHQEPAHPQRCATLSVIAGEVEIRYNGGTLRLAQGHSCLVPAALGAYTIQPAGEAELIYCYLPDLEADVAAPLRAAGYSESEIASLGIKRRENL